MSGAHHSLAPEVPTGDMSSSSGAPLLAYGVRELEALVAETVQAVAKFEDEIAAKYKELVDLKKQWRVAKGVLRQRQKELAELQRELHSWWFNHNI